MVDSGKAGRYFLYAIGEIALVVIGILIALQINNWNEAKQLSQKEIKTLHEFRDALVKDTLFLGRGVMTMESIDWGIQNILDYLGGTQSEIDSLGSSFGLSLYNQLFYPTMGPYESLKSYGFSLISNDTLRNEILDIYEQRLPGLQRENEDYLRVEEWLIQYSSKLFDNLGTTDDVTEQGFRIRKIYPHKIKSLKEDKEYQTLLNTKLSKLQYLYKFEYPFTKRKLHHLLELDQPFQRYLEIQPQYFH